MPKRSKDTLQINIVMEKSQKERWEEWAKKSNCTTLSAFIRKAVEFYITVLTKASMKR